MVRAGRVRPAQVQVPLPISHRNAIFDFTLKVKYTQESERVKFSQHYQ